MIFWYFNFLPDLKEPYSCDLPAGTSTLKNYACNNTTGLAPTAKGSQGVAWVKDPRAQAFVCLLDSQIHPCGLAQSPDGLLLGECPRRTTLFLLRSRQGSRLPPHHRTLDYEAPPSQIGTLAASLNTQRSLHSQRRAYKFSPHNTASWLASLHFTAPREKKP